jgi:transposase
VPGRTIIQIPWEEQEEMLRELRAARYGHLLALHVLLLCARGRTPSEISRFMFCSRSSVYRIVSNYLKKTRRAEQNGQQPEEEDPFPEDEPHPYIPSLKRSLLALVKRAPESFGWCRTRWSCAVLSLQLKAKRGVELSRETIRVWLHDLGWAWKRARHVAKDSDPERAVKLALIRSVYEHLRSSERLLFSDEMDINLLPKLGYEWMRRDIQTEVMTPGKNRKWYLAAALDKVTGKILHVTARRKTHELFLELLKKVERAYPATEVSRIYVVADNYKIHKTPEVKSWLGNHPRIELLWLPTYCPRANPVERVFGDVHDKCTRNHKRKRIEELVADVERYLRKNGPWQYTLSEIYYEEEVDKAMDSIHISAELKAA